MNYRLYSNSSDAPFSSFCFMTDEDQQITGFGGSEEKESISRNKFHLNKTVEDKLQEKYGKYLREPQFVSGFPSQSQNLFIVLGDGFVKVKYSDGEEQIFRNIYLPSDSWQDYQDVWNYSKMCHVELHGNVSLLRIMPEGNRNLWQTKIRVLESEDSSLKIFNFSPLKEKNNTIIHSPEFEFNAVSYNPFDKPVGLIKTFKNNKNITIKTSKYTTIVYSEYM